MSMSNSEQICTFGLLLLFTSCSDELSAHIFLCHSVINMLILIVDAYNYFFLSILIDCYCILISPGPDTDVFPGNRSQDGG